MTNAADERTATARLIELLAEVDARRLYLGEGCSSLFTYCTDVLHLSEHAAYGRIGAARLVRRLPDVREALQNGDATLTTICLIGPHLTPSNCAELLAAVRHKSKREWSGSSRDSPRSRTFRQACGRCRCARQRRDACR